MKGPRQICPLQERVKRGRDYEGRLPGVRESTWRKKRVFQQSAPKFVQREEREDTEYDKRQIARLKDLRHARGEIVRRGGVGGN